MSTLEFSIVCTTCKATLRVRNAAAIGQILACPKCGSMVLVEAPPVEPDEFEDSELALAAGGQEVSSLETPELGRPEAPTGTGGLAIAVGVISGIVLASSVGAYAWLKWSKEDPDATRPNQVQLALDEPESGSSPAEADVQVQNAVSDVAEKDTPRSAVAVPERAEKVPAPVAEEEDSVAAKGTLAEEATIVADAGGVLPPDFEQRETPRESQNSSLTSIAQLLTGVPSTSEQEEPRPQTVPLPVTTLANKSVHSSPSPPMSVAAADERAIAEQLEERIRAVRAEKVPLIDFVRTMSQLSGVPIQLDPHALRQAGNKVDVSVSAVGIDMPVIDLLRGALEPIRMLPVIEGRGVRVTSPRLEDDRVGQWSLFVGDLQSGKGKDLDMATLVATLIEPDSWERAGGVGSVQVKRDQLVVNHTHSVRIRALILLEKLRVARGLRPRKKLPKRYTTLEPRWSQVNRYLRRSINMDVWQEQPLLEVIQQLERASGLHVIVDWLALDKLGVSSADEMALYARQTPAANVFQKLLSFLEGSVLVPISGDAVQITTEQAARDRRYLEFYTLARLGESGRAKVEQLMLDGSAALDPASEVAIVVAAADVHRSLAD